MTMRPEDIKNRTFANSLRGYDKNEVRSFLFKVAESSRELHEQLTATETQLEASKAAVVSSLEPAPDLEVGDSVESDDLLGEAASGADPVGEAASEAFGDHSWASDLDGSDSGENGPGEHDHDENNSEVNGSSEVPDVDALAENADRATADIAAEDLAAAELTIADRYGALGDRIADLLRNADESAAGILSAAENDAVATRTAAHADAEQVRAEAEERASQLLAEAQSIRNEADTYRDQAMAELANSRIEQEAALLAARTAAENEVETFRVDSIAEITSLRSDAFVEIDELRSGATNEIAELRSVAETDAEAMRESALVEAQATLAEDQAEAARLREEAEADRSAAHAELGDVRSEVATLLEQARAQSEFVKQEADEIIRTKVRANFEQAQARIDVLRNTEVASRERIVLAQTELAGALNRLDSEPAPELDPTDTFAVIEEAERRHDELLAGPEGSDGETHGRSDGHGADGDAIDADVIDVDVLVADVMDGDVVDGDVSNSDAIDADVFDVDVIDADLADEDVNVDVDGETQYADGDSLADYFGGADVDPETTGDILTDSFGDDAASGDAAWPTTEVHEVEYETLSPLAEAFGAHDESESVSEAFGGADHPVVESYDYTDTPAQGESSVGAFVDTGSFGAAALSDALPAEFDEPELGTVAQEDALARLVREAMQEAVDSARKSD